MKQIIFFFLTITSFAQKPTIEWQKSYGGSQNDETSKTIETTDGGYLTFGSTRSNDGDVNGFKGYVDIWIVKTNNVGTIQWKKCYGGTDREYPGSIIQTSDGGYAFASTSYSSDGDVQNHTPTGYSYSLGDFWVVKLNSLGTIEWESSINGGISGNINDKANSIFQTSDGGFIVGGMTDGVSGMPNDNILIAKLSSSGSFIWKKLYGSTGHERCNSIIQTLDGGFAILGHDGGQNGGNVTNNHGGNDFWLIKTNASGDLTWQISLGGSNNDEGNAILQSNDGSFYLLGTSASTNNDISGNHGLKDICLFKVSATGTIIWQKSYGGSNDDEGFSITLSPDGNFLLTGSSKSNNGDLIENKGGADYWIIKVEASGSILWQKTFGGSNDDFGKFAFETSNSKIIISGSSNSNNGDVWGNHGQYDMWLAKLNIVPFSILPVSTKAICQSTVTLTAAGCTGSLKWYLDSNGSGTNLTYLTTANTLYYSVSNLVYKQYLRATCTLGTIVSPLSNLATIQAGPDISPLSYLVSPNVPINIFASGCPVGSTYLWSTGETTQTISKSATSYSVYSVKCVSPTCQSAEASSYLSVGNVLANNDSYSLNVDTPFTGNFASNDASLSPKTIYVDYPPSYGTVVWDNNGAFTYSPNSGYQGIDSFKYYLTNGAGSFSNYATVSLSINCPNVVALTSTNNPSNDFNSDVHNRRASSAIGKITASNKITGTAKVNYLAKSIELQPGFRAENGTTFKANVGGCY